ASEQHPVEGIESWSEFRERVWNGLQHVIEQAGRSKDIAIFTSGGPITAIIHKVLRTSPEVAFEMNWAVADASSTKLLYNEQKISLSYFNHYSYLQQGKDHSLVTYRLRNYNKEHHPCTQTCFVSTAKLPSSPVPAVGSVKPWPGCWPNTAPM